MAEKEVFGETFLLDTKCMDQAAADCTKLAEIMRELKQTLRDYKDNLIESWHGEGSRAFQSKYHMVEQQLADLKDELFDMAEAIYVAEDTYIQADMDTAKLLDGVDSPV